MIITATPEPDHSPPRIRLDIDGEGDEFLELTVLRDGRPIRQQPAVMGLTETYAYDYEAPFGVPVTYSASGLTTSGAWVEVYAEDWADLTGWTVTGTPSITGGKFTAGALATASATRDDVDFGASAIRVRFADETALSEGLSSARLGVGAVGVGRTSASGGTAPLRLYSGASSAAIPVDAGEPVELLVAADRRTVTLSQGTSRTSLPLTVSLVPTLEVSASWGGSVGAFTIEVPPVPNSVAESTTVTLDVDAAYFIHPIQPSLSLPIDVDGVIVGQGTDSTRTYAARQSIFQPEGRREAVVFPLGVRGAGDWSMSILTRTVDDRNALLALLDDQAPVLLRSPALADWDLPDGWYAVGDVTVTRPVDISHVEWRQVTLPLTRVAEPPVQLAPSLTWGDLKLRGITWGDLLSKTWLELLMGEV